jgi:hypothetical protein
MAAQRTRSAELYLNNAYFHAVVKGLVHAVETECFIQADVHLIPELVAKILEERRWTLWNRANQPTTSPCCKPEAGQTA